MSAGGWEEWEGPEEGDLVSWQVNVGGMVSEGQPLCKVRTTAGTRVVKARGVGRVEELGPRKGAKVAKGTALVRLGACDHPVVMKDMCAECGMDLRAKDGAPGQRSAASKASIPIVHNIPELHVSEEEAKATGSKDQDALLAARKLVLLLDLDQTLIHTTNHPLPPNTVPDIHSYRLQPNTPHYHTKLRPGLQEFLRSVATKYQLHIVTFGVRPYAHKIARILDPTAELFAHRILSRDEAFDQNLKSLNLASLFPCGDQMVCIVDDREDVWANAGNVVGVAPYRFFRHTGDINAPPSAKARRGSKALADEPSGTGAPDELEELGKEEEPYLPRLAQILAQLHSAFFATLDEAKEGGSSASPPGPLPSLRDLIPKQKRAVLAGQVLVFSSLFPRESRMEECWAFQLAESLGARVEEELRPGATTHLVAAKWGTSKVNAALEHNKEAEEGAKVEVVTGEWLWRCHYRWERVSEEPFRLERGAALKPPPLERPGPKPSTPLVDSGGIHSAPLASSTRSAMFDEVDSALDSDEEEGGSPGPSPTSASASALPDDSDDSLDGAAPKGWSRKRPRTIDPTDLADPDEEPAAHRSPPPSDGEAASDDEEGDGDDESIGSVDEEMADALKDFLDP